MPPFKMKRENEVEVDEGTPEGRTSRFDRSFDVVIKDDIEEVEAGAAAARAAPERARIAPQPVNNNAGTRDGIADDHPHAPPRTPTAPSREVVMDALTEVMGGDAVKALIDEAVREAVSARLENVLADMGVVRTEQERLQGEVSELETQFEQRERLSRNKGLWIRGIPEGYNDVGEVLRLFRELWVRPEVNVDDIDNLYRIGKKNNQQERPRPIFVTLVREYQKQAIYYASKQWLHRIRRGVYINENLTPKNQNLLSEARTYVKEKRIKSAWTRHGVVMVRRQEDAVPEKFDPRNFD